MSEKKTTKPQMTKITVQNGDLIITVESTEARSLITGINDLLTAGSKFLADLAVQAQSVKDKKANIT